MRSNGEITRIANGIYAELTGFVDNLVEVKTPIIKTIKDKSVEEGATIIADLISSIEATMKAPRVDGVGLPSFLSKCVYNEDSLEAITVTIRSKLKAEVKFSKSADFTVDESLVSGVCKFYIDSLYEMFYLEQAMLNIKELNATVLDICAKAEVPYTFEFDIAPDSSAIVLYIDNSKVVFNASISRAHEISSLAFFQNGDGYNDYIREEATEALIASLKAIQTTTQLVKGNVSVIKDMLGTASKKRASKLIRGSYHRKAQYLNKVKAGVGYYNETVKIGDEDVEVFALINKDEDGTLSIVLDPFNVKDLFNVDFDVISAVKEQMGE